MQTTPQNPQNRFYAGEIPEQQQQAPGLQSKLTPKPDCGEETYIGSGKLKGRKALVTGGDSGIGRAAAIAFAKEGADVAINYLPQEQPDAEEVKAVIEKAGQKAVLLPADLRNEAAARQMVDEAAKMLGGMDILVLNAGMQQAVATIEEMDMDTVRATYETNIISMYYTTQQAMQYLPEGASIITTTSIEAYAPDAHLLDYAATKSAIEVFSKGLAKQLAQKGIRVNSVAPGPIWTPLQLGGGQLPGSLPKFGQSTPIGRPGQPVELSDVYVFLASNAASYVTGQVYGVTGGKLTN